MDRQNIIGIIQTPRDVESLSGYANIQRPLSEIEPINPWIGLGSQRSQGSRSVVPDAVNRGPVEPERYKHDAALLMKVVQTVFRYDSGRVVEPETNPDFSASGNEALRRIGPWRPQMPFQPYLSSEDLKAFKEEPCKKYVSKHPIFDISSKRRTIKQLCKKFYLSELQMWCIRLDRAGFRVGPTVGRGKKDDCAAIIFELCKIILEHVHIHRSDYYDGWPEQEIAYDVPIPPNHVFEITYEVLFCNKMQVKMRKNPEKMPIQEDDDEDVAPRRSVREIASELQESPGSQRPVVPNREALLRKGVSQPPVKTESAESSMATAVPPIDMEKIKKFEGMKDQACPHCDTISPEMLWDFQLSPQFMGLCPIC